MDYKVEVLLRYCTQLGTEHYEVYDRKLAPKNHVSDTGFKKYNWTVTDILGFRHTWEPKMA